MTPRPHSPHSLPRAPSPAIPPPAATTRPARAAALAGILIAALFASPPAAARDSLGIFSSWAAFRDAGVPRCYAIALPDAPAAGTPPPAYVPYAAVGTWPRRGIRGALHLRLSHRVGPSAAITLSLSGPSGSRRLRLVGGGGDAWPATPRDDAAIAALLRASATMTVSARDTSGHLFADTYPLAGAATALDAAAIGCASLR